MTAVTSLRTRWIWLIVCAAVICVAAIVLRSLFDPARPVQVDAESPASVDVVQSEEPAEVGRPTAQPSRSDSEHALDELLRAAGAARDSLSSVTDYSAAFSKREQVGRKLVAAKMNLKVRVEPFSVYLKFVEPKSVAGRQVVFVKGANSGNLLVQEAGYKSILGIQPLLPTGSLAMADNRHPVTKIGLHKMVDLVIAQWETDRIHSDIVTRIESDVSLPTAEVCTVYESSVPTPRDNVEFHITRLWVDQKTELAIRIEQLGFPYGSDSNLPVLEDYTYSNVRTNVGLRDVDFDAKKAFQP